MVVTSLVARSGGRPEGRGVRARRAVERRAKQGGVAAPAAPASAPGAHGWLMVRSSIGGARPASAGSHQRAAVLILVIAARSLRFARSGSAYRRARAPLLIRSFSSA